jgi:hypothetical protein
MLHIKYNVQYKNLQCSDLSINYVNYQNAITKNLGITKRLTLVNKSVQNSNIICFKYLKEQKLIVWRIK